MSTSMKLRWLLTLLVLTISDGDIYAQNAEDDYEEKFFKDLYSLLSNIHNSSIQVQNIKKKEKKKFRYQKHNSFKIDSFKIRQVSFVPFVSDSTRISAHVSAIKNRRATHFIGITLMIERKNKNPLETDTSWLNRFYGWDILKDSNTIFKREGNFFRAEYIAPRINKYFLDIPPVIDIDSLIFFYTRSFFYHGFKEEEFYSRPAGGIINLKELINRKEFPALKTLYKTPSRIFNWLVGEQIFYYGSVGLDIPPSIISEVTKLQENGNPHFRDSSMLVHVYL